MYVFLQLGLVLPSVLGLFTGFDLDTEQYLYIFEAFLKSVYSGSVI